jgi:dipeptidyl-peptidase-4
VKHRVPAAVLRLSAPLALITVVSVYQPGADAQGRLRTMPGYDRYQSVGRQIAGSVSGGALTVSWQRDGRSFEFAREGKRYRYDVAERQAVEIGTAPEEAARGVGGRGQGSPERGRQFDSTQSPDKQLRAFHRRRDVWLSDAQGDTEVAVTTDGDEASRVKYGAASWVYGEELDQLTAMWWSPDSRKLAYYRFDEKDVPDYFLQLNQTKLQSTIDAEAYPKAGIANPVVDLFIYDIRTRKAARVDVRDGKPFDNATVGHYVYRIAWSPDGRELLFTRTNRRQNVLELAAANPDTGATRVILREEWPTGWLESSPVMHFLSDGRRFVWESERNGWNNVYLYDLDGTLIRQLTTHATFEVSSIVKIDEEAGVLFYMARDGDNPMKPQLHRVGLDGGGDVRLTDPAFHHTVGGCMPQSLGARPITAIRCGISPDNRFFVDVYQKHDIPPATRLADGATGSTIAEVAQSDVTRFTALGLKKTELFTYKAADGVTTLYGLVHFPSNFDAAKRYPVLVPVYGGPASASNTARETFVLPNANTEYGFLVVNLDSRAAPGRGKRMLDSIYMKLGQVEIDDMADGIKALWSRPYVDRARVGMYGTSYGGYASVMSLLRYPDVYAAASASSPVTAWYHYDTIYTERYMWIPQENKAGYEAGSALTYVKDLKGRLMIYYGTADNNVHPSNAMQLIDALQKAGRSFEVQVGPDRGHSGINPERMMEFFIEHLVLKPASSGGTSF